MRRRWTEAEDALLKCPDRPLPELAKFMGRSLTALHQRRSEKGYSQPRRIEAEPASPEPTRSRRARRAEQQGWVKPSIEARRTSPRIERACLSCRATFTTTRLIFVCATCKSHDIWRGAN
jgi:hypothetical protein